MLGFFFTILLCLTILAVSYWLIGPLGILAALALAGLVYAPLATIAVLAVAAVIAVIFFGVRGLKRSFAEGNSFRVFLPVVAAWGTAFGVLWLFALIF